MGCSNTGLALGCFWARAPTPVELALFCPAALQRWFLTLEPGLLGHGGTAQAGDFPTSGDEILSGVLHPPSLRSSTGNWCHLARSVRVLDWVWTRHKQETEFIVSSAMRCQNVPRYSAGHQPRRAKQNVNSTAAGARGRKQLLRKSAPVQSFSCMHVSISRFKPMPQSGETTNVDGRDY